jgi:hypothetical protein
VVEKLDNCLAWIFGLDDCKYQWAIDRYNQMVLEVSLSVDANSFKASLCRR